VGVGVASLLPDQNNILYFSAFSRNVSERSLDRWNVRGLHSCTLAVVWPLKTKLLPDKQFDGLNKSASQFFKLHCPCKVTEVVVRAAVVLVWGKGGGGIKVCFIRRFQFT
jgi:hypothetical protein